ncbi:hypothetical protein JX265_007383 [Neoarthrinium moseri]|uniref:Uncharacterized protein n=1 Tax=Neoarthrinium moseri TaxID=1658444 RepID=A0A9P9WK45_9PEZI|nr:hypothetical protein JX265_007383 [Neoarthrinium moseri]
MWRELIRRTFDVRDALEEDDHCIHEDLSEKTSNAFHNLIRFLLTFEGYYAHSLLNSFYAAPPNRSWYVAGFAGRATKEFYNINKLWGLLVSMHDRESRRALGGHTFLDQAERLLRQDLGVRRYITGHVSEKMSDLAEKYLAAVKEQGSLTFYQKCLLQKPVCRTSPWSEAEEEARQRTAVKSDDFVIPFSDLNVDDRPHRWAPVISKCKVKTKSDPGELDSGKTEESSFFSLPTPEASNISGTEHKTETDDEGCLGQTIETDKRAFTVLESLFYNP